jgi:hypothetical protein
VAPDSSADHSITMWGPSGTGKTTFLAALSIALIRRGSVWRVAKDRSFPAGTIGIAHYRWELDGRFKRKVRRRWFGWEWREQDVRISLDLVDSQGELAGPAKRSSRADLIKNLMDSSAIIFLYDPAKEVDDGDAFDHTFGVLQQMAQRASGPPGSRLPHYVAVCVSKFDEIRVLSTAQKLGLLTYDEDPPGLPRVPDEDARDLFIELCRVQPSGDAEMVMNLLEQNFQPDRIKYFITSAIGFYVDTRSGRYNPDDYQNHLPDSTDLYKARIRGSIYPINVVEPLLWLTEKLTSGLEE